MEHINIPEGQIHEPKGVSLSAANRVYISNGAGSGSWQQVDADALEGLINNATAAGRRVITDGSGGFTSEPTLPPSYGAMNLTNNTAIISVPAATDSTLNTDSDYVVVPHNMSFNILTNMVGAENYLETIDGGTYLIDFWANAKASSNNITLALKFVVNDTEFVSRRPKIHLSTAGQLDNFSANGIHTFAVGDQIKLYIAASSGTDIVLEDLTFQMNLVELA